MPSDEREFAAASTIARAENRDASTVHNV